MRKDVAESSTVSPFSEACAFIEIWPGGDSVSSARGDTDWDATAGSDEYRAVDIGFGSMCGHGS